MHYLTQQNIALNQLFQQQQCQLQLRQQLQHQPNQSFLAPPPPSHLLLTTPPASPMAATLGYPNRSCVSCKRRKVKCDRLTPSCTACTKSKHNCQYTSYSPSQPLIYDENKFINTSVNCNGNVNNNNINSNDRFLDNKSRLEQPHQRIHEKFHPYYSNPTKYVEFSEPICSPYALGFNSQKQNDDNLKNSPLSLSPSTTTTTTLDNQIHSPIGDDDNCCFDSPPQTLHQQPQLLQLPLQINTSMVAPEIHVTPDYGNDCDNNIPSYQSNYYTPNLIASPVSPSTNDGTYEIPSTVMESTVTFNYNLDVSKQLLGESMAPLLQSLTDNSIYPKIPTIGFSSLDELQNWIRDAFINQIRNNDDEERYEIRHIFTNDLSVQKFEIISNQPEFNVSSPSSPELANNNINNNNCNEETPSDAFLNKIYSYIRKFKKNLPWLRENFLSILKASQQSSNNNSFSFTFDIDGRLLY
nr:12773_t:CDS:2 [Entrophospora candida]